MHCRTESFSTHLQNILEHPWLLHLFLLIWTSVCDNASVHSTLGYRLIFKSLKERGAKYKKKERKRRRSKKSGYEPVRILWRTLLSLYGWTMWMSLQHSWMSQWFQKPSEEQRKKEKKILFYWVMSSDHYFQRQLSLLVFLSFFTGFLSQTGHSVGW